MSPDTSPHRLPVLLALMLNLVIVWSAIEPVARDVWVAEIIAVLLVFGFLIVSYPRFRFSNTAYLLMGFWLCWHTVGAHYTFAHVPFEWFDRLIGSQRNQFDRIAHFSVGFYAYPVVEWLLRKRYCNRPAVAIAFGLFSIMSVAAAYEIIEWLFAVYYGGNAGIEFLGSQGDVWDAQKDMLADTLGAVSVLVLYVWRRPDLRD